MTSTLLRQLRISGLLVLFGLTLLPGCHNTTQQKTSNFQTIAITDSITDQLSLESYIAPYRDTLESQMNRIIGHSEKELLAHFPESPLSNFVADLLLTEAQKIHAKTSKWQQPDFAIINIKGLRAPIAEGEITVREIFQLMPFENELMIIELSGQEVLDLLNFMASIDGDGIGGARFGIKDQKAQSILIGKAKFDPNKTYHVATSDYLANGGDHFDVFRQATNKIGTGRKIRDLIISHIESLAAANKKVTSSIDNRIYHVTK